jgi:putative flippase GtrA
MPSLRGRLATVVGGRLAALRAPGRFGRFLSVGVVGALCDNAVLVLLVELAGLAPLVAGLAAKEASIATMFLLNDRWTFDDAGASGHRAWLRRFLTSNLVRAGGAGVGLATLYVLTEYAGVWYLAANVLGIGVGFLANYAGENLVTWQVHADASD